MDNLSNLSKQAELNGKKLRVFMLGWEFPPFISGGLGTACYGLTKAMSELGMDIVFVLPRLMNGASASHVRVAGPDKDSPERDSLGQASRLGRSGRIVFRRIDAVAFGAYARPKTGGRLRASGAKKDTRHKSSVRVLPEDPDSSLQLGQYTGDMFAEIRRYAALAVRLARQEVFDVVHAHDWMTFPAGRAVATFMARPLVVHVHSTEFDRSGEHVNQRIYDIERQGMHAADRVIAVSNRTRYTLMERYAVPPAKVEVAYNGVDRPEAAPEHGRDTNRNHKEKIVLFLGRITMQKGPEYFLQAAKAVLDCMQDVLFVMAGSGDHMNRCIEMAAALGIGRRVLFTGFLRGDDVRRVYEMADLHVMPSVSEPFGIAPLEALNHNVPVLISKQSGVSEVLSHALKVDFWDTQEMANKIMAVLKHRPLRMTLRDHGHSEIGSLNWTKTALKCAQVYMQTL